MDISEKQKKPISSTQKIVLKYSKFLTAVIVVVILLISYSLVLKPKYQAVRQGGSFNLSTLKDQEAVRQSYLADLKALNDSFSNVSKADIAKVENILPDNSDTAGLLVQLETLALKNNLFLASVDINEAPESIRAKEAIGGVAKIDINLNLVGSRTGDYSGLKTFLTDLENNLRLFDVNSVYFDPESANYSVNLFTYYYP